MVSLRSAMPVGLVTLRHDVPEYIQETTPKVETDHRAERTVVDTPVREGVEAQW